MVPDDIAPQRRFTILIVDDHFVVRNGVMAALELEQDMLVVGSVDSAKGAIEHFSEHQPDVVLLDLQLPDMTCPALLDQLRAVDPHARVLVFSAYAREDELVAVMDAGASGYVQKSAPREEFLIALRRVAAGGRYLPLHLQRRIREYRAGPSITQREREILTFIARGHSNKEIAASLGISVETVKEHISSVLGKLDVRDRTSATTEAIRRGIIALQEPSPHPDDEGKGVI
jgi:DNA-binding NarL/FixJ family response regulator